MKRMILMPKEMADTIARREEVTSTPELDAIVRLGREMDELRGRSDLSLEQKVRQYQDALRQYLHFRAEIMDTKPAIDQQSKQEPPPPPPPAPSSRPIDDAEVTDTLPRTAREKGRQLVRILRDYVTWDPHTKEAIINGERILNSNIQSLIYDAIVPNKRTRPTGSESFARAMDALHVPHNLRRSRARERVPSTPPRRLPESSASPPPRRRRRRRVDASWGRL